MLNKVKANSPASAYGNRAKTYIRRKWDLRKTRGSSDSESSITRSAVLSDAPSLATATDIPRRDDGYVSSGHDQVTTRGNSAINTAVEAEKSSEGFQVTGTLCDVATE
jgi:hypothetical protein